ncbi:hypothetical protein OROMI_031950 [Orobanche minor]
MIPAYLDPTLKAHDLPTGASFASGGCGYDPQTSQLVSVTSLSSQLDQFREYIKKLKGAVGEENANKILSKGLYLVVAGSDDLANTYFTIGTRREQYDISSYADLLVSSASSFTQVEKVLGMKKTSNSPFKYQGCGMKWHLTSVSNNPTKMELYRIILNLQGLKLVTGDAVAQETLKWSYCATEI